MARFSTHGVAGIVEFPTKVQKIARNLQGTTISQNALTDNWLHLPITAEKESGGLNAQQALGVFF
jgi:hypothetical protein